MGTIVAAPLDDVQLFVSYSHADSEAARELFAHLGTLQHDAVFSTWIDRQIGAGESWRPLVLEHLDSADVILLLLSPRFFESAFIRDYELKRAIERHRREDARVIPIALQECEWRQTDIRHLQVIPDHGTPVATQPDRDLAWSDVVAQVGEAVRRLRTEGLRRRPSRPGGQLWRVPFQRNPNFVGREDDLAWLHETLSPDEQYEATDKGTVAVTGLGGIGKTQVVLDYLYRRRNHYRLVWWIRAETRDTVVSDLADLAAPLNLERGEPQNRHADALAVRNYLEHDSRWLLVFDNAPDPDQLTEFLPRAATGHVVITSRHQDWNRIARARELGTLSERDASGLVNRVSGDADTTAAAVLATELGCLPLALAQAAGYMSATGRSIASYVDLYRTKRAALLNRAKGTEEYRDTLLTTWEISFEQVAETSPVAIALLQLSAFLAPEAIPVNLLFGRGGPMPPGVPSELADPLEFDDCTAALRRVSLITMSHGDVSVHRLVQAVGRDRMTPDVQHQYAGAALALVTRAFPEQSASFETWSDCSRLTPHALAVVDHAQSVGGDLDAMLWLLFRTGAYLRRRGHFEAARRCFDRGLAMIGAGPNGPDRIARLLTGELGSTLQEMRQLPDARATLERVLAMTLDDPECSRLDVAHAHNDLGSVLEQMKAFAAASTHYQSALEILREECGPDDERIGVALNNCGSLMLSMGRPGEAVEFLEQALALTARAGSTKSPDYARHLGNLGYARAKLGQFSLARGHLSRAVEILLDTVGPTYPETVLAQQSLAGIEAYMARANVTSLEDLQAGERIVQTLERTGMMFILFDASKLALEGPADQAPPDLLDAAHRQRHAIIHLLRATFAWLWTDNYPEQPALAGITQLRQVGVCVAIDLSEDEAIARLKRSDTLRASKCMPALIPYPVASLADRLATLEAWAPHLPPLE